MMTDRMRTNRKTEEKKMSMNKNIARLAVTAGLTAALSFGGVMAPVTMAFAEGKPTVATEAGKVSITDPITEYADTSFKGIQIFTAKITQNKDGNTWSGDKTLSDIQWAPGNVKTLVTTALKDVPGVPNVNDDAQTWAEFISTTQGSNYGETTAVDNGTVLDLIAEALEGDKALTWTQPSNSSKGEFENLEHGYWLFVTDAPSKTNGNNGNTDAYTSPIFTIVGGSDVNVAPKKSVPNVTKAVMDDRGDKFVTDVDKTVFTAANKAADSASEQPIKYQLAGTVASNINTYNKYSYTFTDELPSTMVPKLNGNDPVVEVKIGNSVVDPACYSATYTPEESKNTLTVSFENLKEAKDTKGAFINVDGSSTVYVNYEAKLDAGKINADMLGKAQVNNVKLTYSNNPYNAYDTGTTVDHPAYDYTYGIDVTKVGSDMDETGKHKTLEGVQFTLQEKGSSKFVKADGTTTSNQNDAILTTTSDGKISVVGLDEGTYILKEVKPAPGYNNSAAGGITFAITNTGLPTNGDPFNPGCDFPEGNYDNLVQSTSAPTGTIDGKVHLTVTDKKGSNLPLTGLNGVTFTWIAGGAVLCIGVAHLIRSRKQAEESEQE
jgi:hypothetical protein